MQTILVSAEDDVPPPTSNGFPVCAYNVIGLYEECCTWVIDTGLSLTLPKGVELRLRPIGDTFVLSHRLQESGRLKILLNGKCEKGDKIAIGYLVRCELETVRFMERTVTGKRVIRGGPAHAECCDTD